MREPLRYGLLFLALIAGITLARAEPSDVSAPCSALDATSADQRSELLSHACYTTVQRDLPEGSIDDPDLLPAETLWQSAAGQELSFTQSDADFWIQINLANTASGPGFWYLKLAYAPLDHVMFVLDSPSGRRVIKTGDHTPFLTRGIDYRYYLLPVTLESEESARVFVRLRSSGALNVPIALVTPDELVSDSNSLTLTHGLFYGALLIFAIFNLLLFVSSGTRYYFYNAFYMASLGMFLFAMGGFAYQYLWPDNPDLANTAIPLAMALCTLSINLFGRSFLNVESSKKFTSRILSLQSGISFALFLLAPYLSYSIAIRVIAIFALLVICNLFFIGIARWRQGQNHAKWYVLSWSLMVLGTLSYALAAFGYLAGFPRLEIIMQGAIGGQVILLNYAMVQRWRQLNLKLLEVEHDAKQKLERQVSERTAQLRETMQDLEKANRKLEALSTQDVLTGLHNRRYLDSRLKELSRESQRTGKPVALVLVDADHFKQINDRYGHAFGDNCLQAIANVLTRNVRRPRDVVARYGGEEFALILPDTDDTGAFNVSETILKNMARESVVSPDGGAITITLSAGIAILLPGESLQSLFDRADKALYRAKDQGRNRSELACSEPVTI